MNVDDKVIDTNTTVDATEADLVVTTSATGSSEPDTKVKEETVDPKENETLRVQGFIDGPIKMLKTVSDMKNEATVWRSAMSDTSFFTLQKLSDDLLQYVRKTEKMI